MPDHDDAQKAAERLFDFDPGGSLMAEKAAIIREYLEPRDRRIAELEALTQYNPEWVQRMKRERDAAIDMLCEAGSPSLLNSRPYYRQLIAARLKAQEQSDGNRT